MAVYIVTGKLGNGKTLVSVARIRDKLIAGCTVATNLNLDLVAMLGPMSRNCRVIRIPDKPSAEDLALIGIGNDSYDESKNGLVVLDECGTWFNSRNWQDKSRSAVNDWFLHTRKLGWDVILIVQDLEIIDSQARVTIAEHTVFCRRLDRIRIPVISWLVSTCTFGLLQLRLPRMHVGRVVYGTKYNDLLTDRWIYRGNDLFAAYDTKQAFLANYPHGPYSYLTPWHVAGRYRAPRNWRFYMRLTRILWRKFKSPIALGAGTLLGVALTASLAYAAMQQDLSGQRRILADRIAELESLIEDPGLVQDSPAVPAPPSPLDRLRDLRIIGALQFEDGRSWYQFADATGAPVVDSQVLAKQGIQVQYRNDCYARLHANGDTLDLHCW